LHGKTTYEIHGRSGNTVSFITFYVSRQSVQQVQTISGSGSVQSAIKDPKTPPLPAVTSRSQIDCGMTPPISVSCRVKAASRVLSPNDGGIVPVKKLSCSCRNSISGKTPMPLMLPVNWLLFRSSCVNELRLRSSEDRLPVNELKSRSMKMRLVNIPT